MPICHSVTEENSMRYKSFRIRNFKGIKDTTVVLDGIAGASVFAFVGLNESGKTTVLEAIHSFSPDAATSELLGGEEGIGVPYNERVPRHLLSEFTDDVSVTANVSVTNQDKEKIAKRLLSDKGIVLNIESVPDEINLKRHQRFKNGDFQNSFFTLLNDVEIKTGNQRKWRSPSADEKNSIRAAFYNLSPDIAYFPTFVFDFPEHVFLTDRGTTVDKFYRRVFQDILDYDGRGHTIERDIIRRVHQDEMLRPWAAFWGLWAKNDDRDKIQHVMDRASAAVTRLVFGRWNKIFGEATGGKEVLISYEIIEGEKKDQQGNITKTNQHDIRIKFQIKDGTRRFDVNDRSLGFRWFFSFMLFTQFRVARSAWGRPLLFLFDEPASNLHAAAQQRLIDSFPEVAKDDHVLGYSTHSHYMIEPKWLEQTFIVTNRSDAPVPSVLEEASLDDESLDVKVTSYRSFVNDHPGQTNYFQPILDRLKVVPSRFDLLQPSVVLEGKSDYYIIRYACRFLDLADLPLMPGLGAGTFGALAAIHVGWNLNFLFVLDGDRQGNAEQARYQEEFGIPAVRIATLTDLVENVAVIEDLLDAEARQIIRKELALDDLPTKNQIRRFFQERLASNNVVPLGGHFALQAKKLVDALTERLDGFSN